MKNTKGFIAGFVLASLLVTPLPVIAKEVAKKINAKENSVTLKVDKYQKKSEKVYIIDNKVYVQMNSMAQLTHKKASYDAKKNTVTFSGSTGTH